MCFKNLRSACKTLCWPHTNNKDKHVSIDFEQIVANICLLSHVGKAPNYEDQMQDLGIFLSELIVFLDFTPFIRKKNRSKYVYR